MVESYQEFIKSNQRLISLSDTGQHRVQIRFLTTSQIEHILLSEIKKWEPYIEEEKNQLRLKFEEDQDLKVK